MNDMPSPQPSTNRRPRTRWARLTALAALAVLTSAGSALAQNVTYVTTTGNDANDCLTPATPCRTINTALNTAGSPGEVRIAKGTYREFLAIQTTSVLDVTLSGNWDVAFTTQSARTPTILRPDTKQSGRVVLLNPGGPGAHLTATLTNLTVTGGNQTLMDGDAPGVGVAIVAFSPAIATVTLDHVTVAANRYNNTSWGGGGLGTRTIGPATIDLTVRDSVFSRNSSRSSGGAIYLSEIAGGHVTFKAERVMLQSNTATIVGGALSIAPDSGEIDTTLSNCFVSGNVARQDGGGVFVGIPGGTSQSLTIENCSFTANTATTGRGGALRVGTADGTFTMGIRNTIAWHDMAKTGADDVSLAAGVTVFNCSIATSNVGEFDGQCADGGGNIVPAVDPKFMQARGPNLHLKPTSPLRGLGDCTSGPSDDIDGQPRGAGCDIGADEIP